MIHTKLLQRNAGYTMGAALDGSLVSEAARAQCWIDYWFHFFETKKREPFGSQCLDVSVRIGQVMSNRALHI